MIRLIAETGIAPSITLGGPPVYRRQGVPAASDQVSLLEYLELDAVGIQLPSGKFVMHNKTQLIRAWAEQTGSSHEDWAMDQSLSAILGNQTYIGGIPATLAELKVTTETVLHVAHRFLNELEG